MITNAQTGTNITEIAEGIYRISTPVPEIPGGFSFNQYLIVDEYEHVIADIVFTDYRGIGREIDFLHNLCDVQ